MAERSRQRTHNSSQVGSIPAQPVRIEKILIYLTRGHFSHTRSNRTRI